MSTVDEEAVGLSVNARRILAGLLKENLTRVELAERLSLSRPTVNGIVAELKSAGLVTEIGRITGHAGRAARLYGVQPSARVVVGVDLGSSHTLAVVSDWAGNIRSERRSRTPRNGGGKLHEHVADLCREVVSDADLPWSAVDTIAIGSPGVMDPSTRQIKLAPNIPQLGRNAFEPALTDSLGVAVIHDNDVNMATVGEKWRGLLQGSTHAAFISVGTGLGMGMLAGGQLLRGASGAAGEIGYVPIGSDAFQEPVQERGSLEERLSARGMLRQYERWRSVSPTPDEPHFTDVRQIFDAATHGAPVASRTVEAAGKCLAMTIAGVNAVLDIERVVLGGGIGSNELLLEHVRHYLSRLGDRQPRVDITVLGHRAVVVGAVAVALQETRSKLLGTVGGGAIAAHNSTFAL